MLHRLLFVLLLVPLVGCPAPAPDDDDAAGDDDDATGDVTSSDGEASVDVPAGAYSGEEPLAVEEELEPPAPMNDGTEPMGPVYEFTPHGATFSEPVTVEIPFDVTLVGSDFGSLQVHRFGDFDPIDALWEPMAGASFSEDGVATFPTTSFSWYTVVRDDGADGEVEATVPCDGDSETVFVDMWSVGVLEVGVELDFRVDVLDPKSSFLPIFAVFDVPEPTADTEPSFDVNALTSFPCTSPPDSAPGAECPELEATVAEDQAGAAWIGVFAESEEDCIADPGTYRLSATVDGEPRPLAIARDDFFVKGASSQ